MADEIIVNVANTLDNIVLNNIINEEVITISVSDNSDQIQIVSTPNLHQVNIIKGLSAYQVVTSVNGSVGDISITKYSISLGNVDNTSDLNKPISTATQSALDLKANSSDVNSALSLKANSSDVSASLALKANSTDVNSALALKADSTDVALKANIASPTFTGTVGGITKSMVGLGNVDNTSDSSKPISTAMQTALDGKQGTLTAGTGISLVGGTISNSAPDQTVSITAGSGITKSGTYPNFTIGSSITQYTNADARGAISLTTTGTSGAATFVTNTLNVPTYTLAGLGGQASSTNLTSLSGLTYASTSFVKMTAAGTFALDTTAYTANTGTVTSVGGTGTVNGLNLTGTVTTSGNLTLGGTLDLSSPPAIGGTTASTGRFTTITSTIATGTAPFTVASTTNVANLNASSLNGATFASPGTIGGTTAGAGNFTSVSVSTGYYDIQPTPTALTATATLTIAQIQGDIITVTSSTAVSLTLPTGTLTDAGVLGGALQTNGCFDWFIINLGSTSGAVTMVAGTAHTYVGNATVAISTSAQFRTRKTATNTFVTYRIG